MASQIAIPNSYMLNNLEKLKKNARNKMRVITPKMAESVIKGYVNRLFPSLQEFERNSRY